MKLRYLIAFPCLLIGVTSLAAVAYLTWRDVVHGDGMSLWIYVILILAGIPLAITWWKDLVATEWVVIISSILAASVVAVGFVMVHGILNHDTAWHAFMPEESSPRAPAMTTEEFLKNMPPPKPVWPKIAAYFVFMFSGSALTALIYKGSLFCLRSLCRRKSAAI